MMLDVMSCSPLLRMERLERWCTDSEAAARLGKHTRWGGTSGSAGRFEALRTHHEMKILVPEIAYVPSPLSTALVTTCPRSEPHCGSVRHMVPVNSPLTRGGRYLSLSLRCPCGHLWVRERHAR